MRDIPGLLHQSKHLAYFLQKPVTVLRLVMSKTKAQRPPKPKPPRTAFMCFYQLHQQKLKDANSSLSFGEINTVVVNAWKGIGGAEKQQCDQLAQKDKTRYQRELRGEFENCASEVRSSRKRHPGRLLLLPGKRYIVPSLSGRQSTHLKFKTFLRELCAIMIDRACRRPYLIHWSVRSSTLSRPSNTLLFINGTSASLK